ncbi:MAG: hypothetical protein ACK5EU_05650 [Pseudanabaena sp.]|jgi:hypothetical protein|nr:hypothetical protein [Pseudanabaena sp. M53BS1SP1A06MG]MCA6582320.1 hypothetical protein [Pseudanabaena sp. M34BS1SP1A06MG]MCA6587016.1 hypothetical protein [Pseudanabaena sp. M051S1SP1A06QC]MCA6594121.1 hypothetical protein [Pseudanabaena sp. M38BS1SP1A06MG]MCA6601831.1 hypothetical protein [Pseudanabaena sp. M57BS1SP1A06MG]MCA6612010.1 hypothetical protein [Pseudanabaena sp. M158S2SP1A06QC]MCA6623657.1 hypothetical protein [Pseudanabaena sp. M165S2SP1A06QC]
MKAEFYYSQRKYECSVVSLSSDQGEIKELRIRNPEGEILAVQQGQKIALRGKSRATSQEVDILKSNYYNLVKSAVTALDLEEKQKLIKDKDEQIRLLNAEISIFREKADLSDTEREEILHLRDQIKALSEKQTTPAFNYDEQEIEAKLLKRLGKNAWHQLETASRKDLFSAYKHKYLVESDIFTENFSDYKPSCLYIASVVEREIVHSFFKSFYWFMCQQYSQQKEFVIAGVTLRNRGKYTIGSLPYLIAKEWDTFREEVLNQEYLSSDDRDRLYYQKFNDQKISTSDHQLVKEFLAQWQHPLSQWLRSDRKAASKIDQIAKLRNLTAHPMPIYKWQFTELWLLVIGGKTKSGRVQKGLLKEIYETVLS